MHLLRRSAAPLLVATAYLVAGLAPCPAGVERVEHEGHVHAVVTDARGSAADAAPRLAPVCPCGCEKSGGTAVFWGRVGVALPRSAPEPPTASAAPAPVLADVTLPPDPVFGIDPVPI